jgi:hypothetical protein
MRLAEPDSVWPSAIDESLTLSAQMMDVAPSSWLGYAGGSFLLYNGNAYGKDGFGPGGCGNAASADDDVAGVRIDQMQIRHARAVMLIGVAEAIAFRQIEERMRLGDRCIVRWRRQRHAGIRNGSAAFQASHAGGPWRGGRYCGLKCG